MYTTDKDLRTIERELKAIKSGRDLHTATTELIKAYKALAVQVFIIYHDNASTLEIAEKFDCTADEVEACYKDIIPFEIRRADAVNRTDFYDRKNLTPDEAVCFFENLRNYLDTYRLTFVQLASLADVPRSCIQRYYNRESKPTPDIARKVAEAMKITLHDLLNETVFKKPVDKEERYSGKKQSRVNREHSVITEAQAVTLADNLKDYRHLNGLSQAQLAKITGLSLSPIANIEALSRRAEVKTVYKIAAALHVGADRLLNQRNAFGEVTRRVDNYGNEDITGRGRIF